MKILEFKRICSAVLDRLRRTVVSIIGMSRGQPTTEVELPARAVSRDPWIGSMRQTARIVGDLVSPASTNDDWEVLGS